MTQTNTSTRSNNLTVTDTYSTPEGGVYYSTFRTSVKTKGHLFRRYGHLRGLTETRVGSLTSSTVTSTQCPKRLLTYIPKNFFYASPNASIS